MGIKTYFLRCYHWIDTFMYAHPLRFILGVCVLVLIIKMFTSDSRIKKLEREIFGLKLKLK